MRHLLKYENRKLWHNRLFCLALIFLLLLGCVLQVQQLPRPLQETDADSLGLLLQAYADDPHGTEAKVREEQAEIDRLSAMVQELYDERRDEEAAALAATILLENYLVNRRLLSLIDTSRAYPATLQQVIGNAKKQQAQFLAAGGDHTGFTARYQEGIIRYYSAQLSRNLSLPVDEVLGWDHALEDTSDAISQLLVWLIGGVLLFLPERGGMLLLIRSTRRGRLPTAIAKLLCGALMSVTVTALFSGTQLLLLALRTGLHGATLPLQSVLPLAPFRVSIFGGYVIKLAIRALVGVTFVWLIMLISLFCRRYIAALALGTGLIGVSYYLHIWGAFRTHHPLRMFNLLDMIMAQDYLISWNAVRLGYQCVEYRISLPLVLLGMALAFGGLNIAFYTSGRFILVSRQREGQAFVHRVCRACRIRIDALQATCRKKSARTAPQLLIRWEWHKISRHLLTPILLLLLIIGEIWLIGARYAPNTTWRDSVYEHYMTVLEGNWSEEKSAWLHDEQRSLRKLAAQKNEIYAQYMAGELSIEEYRKRIGAATDAELTLEVLDTVLEKDAYLKSQAKRGRSVVYLYDTGWQQLLCEREDGVLLAALILLFAGLFSDEHSLRTPMILRTTKKGRRSLFFSKLCLSVLLSGMLQLLLLLARILVLNIHYALPQPQASVMSMIGFESMNGSILATAIGVVLLRWLAAMAFALMIAAASACLRSTVASALLCALSVYLSPLLALFGLHSPYMQGMSSILCATPLLQGGSDHILAAIALGVLIITLLLAAWRERSLDT